MRASKWLAGTLAVFLLSGTMAGCTVMRTPYEQEKMKEMGGAKKPAEEGGGGGGGEKKQGGGGEGGGGGEMAGAPDQEKKKKDEKGKEESGGGGGKKKDEEGKAETAGQDKAKTKDKGGKQGRAYLYATPADESPRLLFNQQLSNQVSEVEGVASATVLLDEEHKAYVALAAPDSKTGERSVEENKKLGVTTEGEIPKKTQEKIQKALSKSDPLIEEVYITNDPRHVENFNRYAVRSLKGDVDDNRL